MTPFGTQFASVRRVYEAVGAWALVALALQGSAHAGANDPGAETPTSGELQEVVVTAEKREETIEKVPISVAVLGRNEMMDRQISDMAGVAAITPGVDFQATGSTIALSIRGISSGISGYSTTGILEKLLAQQP